MSLDQFFFRRYDLKKYNCLHLAAEVWAALTGEDILVRLEGVMNGLTRDHVKAFETLKDPVSPCLVLLRKKRQDIPHIGVYLDRRIMHITCRGVQYQPVDVVAAGFTNIRWFR